MADEYDEGGPAPAEDAAGLVAGDDAHVDRSQLKLPGAVSFAGKEMSGEEDEDVLLKM